MMSAEDKPLEIDVWERTKGFTGPAEAMNRRLFMQLLVFDADPSIGPRRVTEQLDSVLSESGAGAVVYQDVNNPFAIGLLTWSEDPSDFVTKVRPCFENDAGAALDIRPEFTMIGRTYATGYEPDLEQWLIRRPAETVLDERWPWAVWYPLRRSGAFARLEPQEQGTILREHAEIGKAYGQQDLAHDVRLACHGLDASDNEFVIGLIGKELHPLSHVVQGMRKTRQTSEFISQMGPFFVGYAVSRHAPK
jgi:chlorite dismutase